MPGTSQPDSTARTVRCPACRREHAYEPPVLPCSCGAALKVPLLRGGVPVLVQFRSWEDSWLSMRCPRCGRSEQWPQPEFTCGCGSVVRLPVDTSHGYESALPPPPSAQLPRRVRPGGSPPSAAPVSSPPPAPPSAPPSRIPERAARDLSGPHGDSGPDEERVPFLPHPVRTSEDAVVATASYLEWLGFDDLEVSDSQDRDGVCLLGARIVAQVDTWTEPADLRAVECVWLNTLHADELAPAMFTLAGYSREALNRADQLLVALFELDLAGMPQPVNSAAHHLIRTGSTS